RDFGEMVDVRFLRHAFAALTRVFTRGIVERAGDLYDGVAHGRVRRSVGLPGMRYMLAGNTTAKRATASKRYTAATSSSPRRRGPGCVVLDSRLRGNDEVEEFRVMRKRNP